MYVTCAHCILHLWVLSCKVTIVCIVTADMLRQVCWECRALLRSLL